MEKAQLYQKIEKSPSWKHYLLKQNWLQRNLLWFRAIWDFMILSMAQKHYEIVYKANNEKILKFRVEILVKRL